MKECLVEGLAGETCKILEGCYFKEALKLEPDNSDGLKAFKDLVEKSKEGCRQSGEVLAEITRRIRDDTPRVES